MCRLTTRASTKSKMEFSSLNMNLGCLGSPETINNLSFSANDIWNNCGNDGNSGERMFNDYVFEDENTNLKPFHELGEIKEVWSPPEESFDLGQTQNLIDEVEEFLSFHEKQNNSSDQSYKSVGDYMDESDVAQQTLENESKMAEDVLDSLIRGTITMKSEDDDDTQVVSPSSSSISDSNKSSLIDTSNVTDVSEFVLEDGRNVIIMIAAPSTSSSSSIGNIDLSSPNEISDNSPGSACNPTSPSDLSLYSSSSDSEWTPKTTTSLRRVASNKKSYVKKQRASKYSILDKKERKKWQNVEAARRYRDKKKIEQAESELEIKMLEDKNKALNDQLSNMTNEVSTLKKLMIELGIINSSM